MYIVIKEKDVDVLQKKVKVLIKAGWLLAGGISMVNYNGDILYGQALYNVKRNKKEKIDNGTLH